MELSNEKLEEMVVGKKAAPNVVFYDQSLLDVNASKEQGRRVYKTMLMVKRTLPGVTDWVAERARREDILKHPVEYEQYQKSRAGVQSPSVTIIPGIQPHHVQELIDYGLGTVHALVAAELLPKHLEYARIAAKIIINALEEITNGDEEESVEENSEESSVQPIDRRIDSAPVERQELPRVQADSGEAGQRLHESGRKHGGESVTIPSPNWSLTIG